MRSCGAARARESGVCSCAGEERGDGDWREGGEGKEDGLYAGGA